MVSMRVECTHKNEIMMDEHIPNDLKITLIEDHIEAEILIEEYRKLPKETTEESNIISTNHSFLQTQSHHILDKIKEKLHHFKENMIKLKSNISKKIKKVLEKLKKKLEIVGQKMVDIFNKPIVKTFIFFIACSLPAVNALVTGGILMLISTFTGGLILNILKNGPNLAKLLVESFKSLRSGFKDKNSVTKYKSYGEGAAGLILVIVLATVGAEILKNMATKK